MMAILRAHRWHCALPSMLITNIIGVLLLLAGPIVAYEAAVRRPTVRRSEVVAAATAGGAAAGVLLIVMQLLSGSLVPPDAGTLLGAALPLIGASTIFGFALGFAGTLVTYLVRSRSVFTAEIAIVGVMAVVSYVIISSTHRPTEAVAVSQVSSAPRVFGQELLVVCVPRSTKTGSRRIDDSLTPPAGAEVAALPLPVLVQGHTQMASLPREVLADCPRTIPTRIRVSGPGQRPVRAAESNR